MQDNILKEKGSLLLLLKKMEEYVSFMQTNKHKKKLYGRQVGKKCAVFIYLSIYLQLFFIFVFDILFFS